MVGYMCGLLFNDWTYLDACESGDLHTSVARLTWPNLGWKGDLKKDKEIAEQIFYRHFTYRDCCKKLGHGTNFLGKAPTLSKLIHIPINLVEPFQEKYFDGFPALQMWHAWTATELQTKKQLVSIHGRRRDFFDRIYADETLRKGLAFLAASATADNLNLGMWRLWKHMPEVQLLAQVHDAIYFQFPNELKAEDVVSKAEALLRVELRAPNGRKFAVPTEAKIGHNWGNASEKNPNGLKKFKLS
jgi:DNA polymerase I-like protein with 3'-5' exonuclease and polymerase domains